ncbi:hypothetical protein MTP09_00435 [Chryseobacterium suipulveris]|uniref:Uncharacterized protein n=1 Tax=Chryseobacterium suipulveris TaxID=2929800 RepID=A0ABY4BPM5_9FLAO|nr:hypothetical protein [Chryseobacterium suipulveris]UOE41148.1 hypothetical protein MTP09_00435 [Chryseobacterium suipulveris]
METIIVQTENKEDLKLLKSLFEKLKLRFKVLTDDEKENLAFTKLMKGIDRTKTVSKEQILNILE